MEFARRSGDYALVGAAAAITPSLDDHCMAAHLAFLGISGYPVRAREVEQLLVGTSLDEQTLNHAAELAQTLVSDDMEDVHATVDYCRCQAALRTLFVSSAVRVLR